MLRVLSVALALSLFAFSRLLPASAGPVSNTTVVNVPATSPSTDSGVALLPGDRAIVTATGTWDVCGSVCASGPNGNPVTNPSYCLPTANEGALLGSLDSGSTYFVLGTGPTNVTGPGELLFTPNDCLNFSDNQGSLSVTITVYSASQCQSQTFDQVVTMTSPIYTSYSTGRLLVLAPSTGNATVNLPLAHDSCVISGSGRLTASIGGAGRNTLIGGPERDTLTAGSGNDLLIGGGAPTGQRDTLSGGAGTDICIGMPTDSVKFGCELSQTPI